VFLIVPYLAIFCFVERWQWSWHWNNSFNTAFRLFGCQRSRQVSQLLELTAALQDDLCGCLVVFVSVYIFTQQSVLCDMLCAIYNVAQFDTVQSPSCGFVQLVTVNGEGAIEDLLQLQRIVCMYFLWIWLTCSCKGGKEVSEWVSYWSWWPLWCLVVFTFLHNSPCCVVMLIRYDIYWNATVIGWNDTMQQTQSIQQSITDIVSYSTTNTNMKTVIH